MNMTSKGSQGEEGVHFGNLSILSLLFANDVGLGGCVDNS